jgi:hypothetical protein
VNAERWRAVAGIAVLIALAVIGVALLPPYIQNWKLQQYVNQITADPASADATTDAIRANIVNRATSLGLPVHSRDVQVTRTGGSLQINVMYVVKIDLPAYTVDLHFRPAAGGT